MLVTIAQYHFECIFTISWQDDTEKGCESHCRNTIYFQQYVFLRVFCTLALYFNTASQTWLAEKRPYVLLFSFNAILSTMPSVIQTLVYTVAFHLAIIHRMSLTFDPIVFLCVCVSLTGHGRCVAPAMDRPYSKAQSQSSPILSHMTVEKYITAYEAFPAVKTEVD